ncbi:MAG: hypothetical protein HY289_01600 [Planctomycetes bacterium]|nr:hypothetical protein [Planctomycetota bacterium]
MTRALFAILIAGALQAYAVASPFQANKKPDAPAQPEDRGKIVEQIHQDSAQTVDRLNQRDPGAETRSGMKRILEALDKLIDQQDPKPSPPPSSSSPPKQPAGNPPPPIAQQPKPLVDPQPKKIVAEPKQAPGQAGNPPRTPEAVQKERSPTDLWPPLPPRHRAAMDAFAKERFIRNYEELLRAYYRNIAEKSSRDD